MSRKQHTPLPDEGLPVVPAAASQFVYLLSCADGTLYTGYTTHVARRLAAHNAGTGARYTRGRRPVTLVACWTFRTKGEALRAERTIKGLSRGEKLSLAQRAGAGEGADQYESACSLERVLGQANSKRRTP